MTDLVLSEREQRVLRSLMASEPVPGDALPTRSFLRDVERLVPSDSVGACLALNTGPITEIVEVHPGYRDDLVVDIDHGGPFSIGTMHWSRRPLQATACRAILPGHIDGLAVGFRSGPDAVAQIFFHRRKRPFSERDLAMVELLSPVFQRHLRRSVSPALPASLTVQERRVLMEVAAGLSNPEIAETLFISVGTVRKHLEHAFRKLGVTNRLAAVVALEGRRATDPDREARIVSYA